MSRRGIVGLAILTLWLIVLGVHIRREYFKSDTLLLTEGAQALAPGSYFYSVRMNDRAIGMATSRLDTVPEGFLFEDLLRLEVPALDTVHPAVVQTRALLDPALQLIDFSFRLDSEIGRFAVTGEARDDSLLDLRMDAGRDERTTTVPLDRSLTLPIALPLRLAASGALEVGSEYRARVFDPSSMSDRPVTLRVTERSEITVADSVTQDASGRWIVARLDTVTAWVVEESYGGVSVKSWLDQDGRLVRAESPMGFTLVREPFELADQRWKTGRADRAASSGYGSIIESTAIASDADLSGVDRVAGLVLRLRDVDLQGFDLDGGRQSLRGDTLVIRREAPGDLRSGYSLPYTGDGEPAGALESTPLIQADDPAIRAAALRITGGSKDPAVAARALNAWVYEELRKDITLSIPSAVQVLEERRGDCNEHAVLYVALARSLGLPARTAVGLVHLRGRFYYHAWPEVWLGESWVAVDPTLGQYPADAAHVRFLTGGLARQIELIRLIGRLDLDVVRMIE